MARKVYPYSLDRHDAKIAGVCSTLGAKWGIDPTFIRVAWVGIPLLTPVDFTTALVVYAIVGIYLAIQKKKAMKADTRISDFDRMDMSARRRPSVDMMRKDLDVNDRRLMAIDHHLNSQNDELAREIEALRQEEK
jgi:phage shock protein PspC (stress-responsive transcriptional regulator)